MTISIVVRFISRLFACSSVEYQFLYHVARKIKNKTKISNYGTHGFSDGGKNPRFAPVKFNMKGDGGKRAGFAHVNLLS